MHLTMCMGLCACDHMHATICMRPYACDQVFEDFKSYQHGVKDRLLSALCRSVRAECVTNDLGAFREAYFYITEMPVHLHVCMCTRICMCMCSVCAYVVHVHV